MRILKDMGAQVVGVGSVVDRSAGGVDFGVPFRAVLSMEVKSDEADECPNLQSGGKAACKAGQQEASGKVSQDRLLGKEKARGPAPPFW